QGARARRPSRDRRRDRGALPGALGAGLRGSRLAGMSLGSGNEPRLRAGKALRFVPPAAERAPGGEDALRAERLQARARARLRALDPGLERRVVWEPYDADSGRADASVALDCRGGEYHAVDVWLLCGPAQIWLLVVGYVDEAWTFQELGRQRWERPEPAAEAF